MSGSRLERVAFEDFEIDLITGEVRRGGVKVRLQDKPFAVLVLLLERPAELVTREEIRERVWGAGTYIDFDQALNKAIKNIREALGDSAEQPRYVETLPKRGYRFIATVSSREKADPQTVTAEAGDIDPNLSKRTDRWTELTSAKSRFALRSWYLRVTLIIVILASGFLLGLLVFHNSDYSRELRLKQLTTNNVENSIRNTIISPDGRYLLFGDQIGIHLRVITTGEVHTFQRPKGLSAEISWYPTAWFPDQTHFLAVSEALNDRGVIPTSWIVSLLGDGATELREGIIAQTVSPDATRIAFTTGGEGNDQQIGIMGAAGEEPIILDKGGYATWFSSLEWSPDGRRIFNIRTQYAGSKTEDATYRHVLESRPSGGGAPIEIVSYALGKDSGFPGWSGGDSYWLLDKGRVIYNRNESVESRAGNDDTNLWEVKINADTGEPRGESRRLSKWAGNHLDHLSISRDGKSVVLQRSNWQLHTYIGDLDGPVSTHPLRRLTLEESDDVPYGWTPDSRSVLFESNRNGTYRLYRQSIAENVAEPIDTGPGKIGMAKVSPDGLWIIYAKEAENGHRPRVMRLGISGGPPHLVMETKLIPQIFCPIAPATRCVTLEEAIPQVFRSFDPVKGDSQELFRLPFWGGAAQVTPSGNVAILREDSAGARIQILSQSGTVVREAGLSPWNNFSGMDWSSDLDELYMAALGPSGATILRVKLAGEIQPLWLLKGSSLAWAIPSRDNHHVAVLGKSAYSNAWMVENF